MDMIELTPVRNICAFKEDGLIASVELIRKQRRYGIHEFATEFLHISGRTYQSWLSRDGKKPSGAALSLLRIVAARPDIVEEVLSKAE